MNAARDLVLIMGSGPGALVTRDWAAHPFDAVVAINNAWQIRPDWTHHIHPEDFPPERGPETRRPGQETVLYREYVPSNNRFGGVFYAGGTMAFTAGYWALDCLRPRVLAFVGCDMVYPATGKTHFYGSGTADPLRADPTLRSLEAKAARLWFKAAGQGCACVNLSQDESRLVFPRTTLSELGQVDLPAFPEAAPATAERLEREADYNVPSGRYWEQAERFDPDRIDAIDGAWRDAYDAMRAGVRS
ncbi:hypothetical protein [Aliiruegeria lutimaris]|uniref:Uncharacterized protein n=1 Tax=Aliiruegeria lutimaris TaxID=571298 RepID=A0A1G8LCM5_9RHOB|nr:hypothetical protein [Aliiruegeria lutimaris]SDI53464.1 hypothetical protein SAMN04488026_100416 [Aliiruegeria lutimaris]